MLYHVLSLALLGLTQATPFGAPDIACETMFPTGHNTTEQLPPPPYTFSATLNVDHYIVSLTSNPAPFRGFYFQARQAGSTVPVGVFSLINPDDSAQTRACQGATDGAATHIFNDDKLGVSVRWDANGVDPATVTFQASVVQVVETFWIGLTTTP